MRMNTTWSGITPLVHRMHDKDIKHLINTSGGKDSTATILEAIEFGVEFVAVFADTGNEHRLTYEYLDYLEDRLGITIIRVKPDFAALIEKRREFVRNGSAEKGFTDEVKERILDALEPTGNPFLDCCAWKGFFPARRSQFCTQFLKRVPMFDEVQFPLLNEGYEVWSWQGIRRDESMKRRNYVMFEPDINYDTESLFSFRPIIEWSAEDTFAMHDRHGIEPNPLYKMGMSRVGCMPCINSSKPEILAISQRFPEVIDKVRGWEEHVRACSKKGLSTFFHAQTLPEARGGGDTRSHIDNVVSWSKTDRRGQFNMLLEAPAECSSQYGLCE